MKQIDCIYNDSPEKKQTSSYSSCNKSSFKEKGKHSKVDSHGDLTETYNSKEDRPSTKSLIKSYEKIIDMLSEDEEKEKQHK